LRQLKFRLSSPIRIEVLVFLPLFSIPIITLILLTLRFRPCFFFELKAVFTLIPLSPLNGVNSAIKRLVGSYELPLILWLLCHFAPILTFRAFYRYQNNFDDKSWQSMHTFQIWANFDKKIILKVWKCMNKKLNLTQSRWQNHKLKKTRTKSQLVFTTGQGHYCRFIYGNLGFHWCCGFIAAHLYYIILFITLLC
jgi:hypothetical protein